MDTPCLLTPIETVADAEAFVASLGMDRLALGLGRVQKALARMGNPQNALPLIHVGGTNGKGSVSALLSRIFQEAGISVGTFTSPHLITVRERIALNGTPISEADFRDEVATLRQDLLALGCSPDEWPTYFEFLTLLAFRYFQNKQVSMSVFEVGLGGRLDATNVVDHPRVTVITGIDYDHQDRLGETLQAIATEKAGILKHQVPLVLGPDMPAEALKVFDIYTRLAESPVYFTASDRLIPDIPLLEGGAHQRLKDPKTGQSFDLGLLGPYQAKNAATVLAVLDCLRETGIDVPDTAIQSGFRNVSWPCRFEYFPAESLLLDGSHNPQGFDALCEGLETCFPHRPRIWLLSLRNNRSLSALADRVVACGTPHGFICIPGKKPALYHAPRDLASALKNALGAQAALPIRTAGSPREGLSLLRAETSSCPENLGVVSGSLYTAGEILRLIRTCGATG